MEEMLLIEKAKMGDKEACDKIFRNYSGLIVYRSNKFYMPSCDREDFIQEGRIGLFKAIKSYNHTKGATFSTFASLCIDRQLITAYNSSRNAKSMIIKKALLCNNKWKNEWDIDKVVFCPYDNPESHLLLKEKMSYLEKNLKKKLSKMEVEILKEMLLGLTYLEIAEKIKRTPKSVDNAIQRVKQKVKQSLKY